MDRNVLFERVWVILLSFTSTALFAQQITWADKALEASSYYDNGKAYDQQFGASQAVGPPNVLPAGRVSPVAWCPARENARQDEWVKVGFSTPLYGNYVTIHESLNPGAITHIYAYNAFGEELLVYENLGNQGNGSKSRLLTVEIVNTGFEIAALKLVLSTVDIPGWNQIDAVGLSLQHPNFALEVNEVEGTQPDEKESLGELINSPYHEVNPIISPDGQTLFFTRKNHPSNTMAETINDDIWFAAKHHDSWSQAIQMKPPLNNKGHNFVSAITPDGNTMLLGNKYLKSGYVTEGISISQKTDNGWSFPEPLKVQNYYNYHVHSEFFLSNSRKVLLLAIERRDGIGSRDIFVSFKRGDGQWTKPKNLGPVVNTADTELTPFLASDEKTLYFASAGHPGYGKTDMFVTTRLDDSWTNWSTPRNLGSFFNSEAWDASYTLDASGEYVYFVSYKGSNRNSADLFRAKLPLEARPDPVVLVSGRVLNVKTGEPVMAEISYESYVEGKPIGDASSDAITGAYKITLPAGEKYSFFAFASGYFSELASLDLRDVKSFAKKQVDLELTPINVGEKLVLKNIFFEQGEPTLLPESFPELRKLVMLMNLQPMMRIKLIGHTDIDGNAQANEALSLRRAETIKDYLAKHEVERSRIETEGKGGLEPLTIQRTDEAKKLNRRVVIQILSK